MLGHFAKVFIRNSWKRKTHAAITLFGLVLGMTAFALISLYSWNELSYDTFHQKKDRIFRVRQDRYTHGALTRQWTAGPWGIGADLKKNFPEVVRHVSVNRGGVRSTVLANGDLFFREERVLFASEDFFKLFSYPLVKGIDSLVLKRPFTMVISESLAKRYFGDADPIGKTLKNNGKEEYEITGVFQDVPSNTHLKFDALFSFESLLRILGPKETDDLMTNWGWAGNYTYIELSPSADAAALQSKIPAYVEKEAGEVLRSWGETMAFVLQPVPSIHLYSNHKDELEPNGDGQSVNILIGVAIFILILAWINYVNLITARSMERAREVGIRKVLGSFRIQLVRQFLLESFLTNVGALFLTIVLTGLLFSRFSAFVGREMTLAVFQQGETWWIICALFLASVLGAGLYPAFVLSGLQPLSTLKGRFQSSTRGIFLRKCLVTFQFVTCIALLIVTFTVYEQIHFMRRSDLGLDADQILVVQGPDIKPANYETRFKTFRDALKVQTKFTAVTVSSDVPGRTVRGSNGGVRLEGQETSKGNSYRVVFADPEFKEAFGLSLIAGRWFSHDRNEHWKTAVVNETAMHLLGFNEPEKVLGKRIYVWDGTLEIVGVIKDYHQEYLKRKVDQLIFVYDQGTSDFFSVKIKKGQRLSDAVKEIENTYQAAFPGNPFYSFFLDDYFNQQYQSDRQFGHVFGLFSMVAILISCLGLFGLASYLVLQRTKEISIRKVLGASVRQLVALLAREFAMVMLLATIIAWPISFLVTGNWLNDFAYRISLSWYHFAIPSACILIIVIVSVGSQSMRAASQNPVNHLRTV